MAIKELDLNKIFLDYMNSVCNHYIQVNTFKIGDKEISSSELVDRFNKISYENVELIQENNELRSKNNELRSKNKQLEEELKESNRIRTVLQNNCILLEKRNDNLHALNKLGGHNVDYRKSYESLKIAYDLQKENIKKLEALIENK